LDNFKYRLKSGIFKCFSWLNGSVLGNEDRGVLKEEVEPYLTAFLFLPPFFYLSSTSIIYVWTSRGHPNHADARHQARHKGGDTALARGKKPDRVTPWRQHTIRWSNFDRWDPKIGVFLQSTEATPCGHPLKGKLTPENPPVDTMFMVAMAMVLL
jgi:hypothetical protein